MNYTAAGVRVSKSKNYLWDTWVNNISKEWVENEYKYVNSFDWNEKVLEM